MIRTDEIAWKCGIPRRPDLENRIRELENEVTFLKGKIEGMRSVPLPIQPVYREPERFCQPVPSTKKPVVPPFEITCTISGDVTGSIGLELE